MGNVVDVYGMVCGLVVVRVLQTQMPDARCRPAHALVLLLLLLLLLLWAWPPLQPPPLPPPQ